jgi:hypothetical protein
MEIPNLTDCESETPEIRESVENKPAWPEVIEAVKVIFTVEQDAITGEKRKISEEEKALRRDALAVLRNAKVIDCREIGYAFMWAKGYAVWAFYDGHSELTPSVPFLEPPVAAFLELQRLVSCKLGCSADACGPYASYIPMGGTGLVRHELGIEWDKTKTLSFDEDFQRVRHLLVDDMGKPKPTIFF